MIQPISYENTVRVGKDAYNGLPLSERVALRIAYSELSLLSAKWTLADMVAKSDRNGGVMLFGRWCKL